MTTYQLLRPRQESALAALRQLVVTGERKIVVQGPTGLGKTRLAAAVVEGALRKNKLVMFSVPALSLIDQTVTMFWRNDIRDLGVIQATHEKTDGLRPVQVASIQTLMRRDVVAPDVMIIDEVHRWFVHYEKLLAEWTDTVFIGLSATPWTKGLGLHFGPLVVAGTIDDGIKEGWLSNFRTFAPYVPKLSGVRTVAGDFHLGDLSGAMDMPKLTADIVSTWLDKGRGRPTFLFAVDRAHAAHLADRFAEAGVRSAYLDAFSPVEERELVRQGFEAGEIEVVCNVGVLTTGIDWDVRCIILARPTKSEMLYVQMLGRGLRPTPEGKSEKDHLLVLDHSGTSLKLGLINDIHYDSLDTTKKGEKQAAKPRAEKLPKACPACAFLIPAGIYQCPACGFQAKKQTSLTEQKGELRELTMSDKGPSAPRYVKDRWLAMLAHIARRRGYNDKWPAANYRERFGHWPDWGWREVTTPVEPDPEVLSWVMSRMIAYAKSKKHRAPALT